MKKSILIAGGTDGIGLAFVRECLQDAEYNTIYVLGRNFSSLKTIRDPRVIPLVCDITDSAAVHAAIGKIKSSLDVFVNTIGSFLKKPVAELTDEDIRRHVDLNTTGNIILTTAALPKLKKTFSQVLVCLATLAVEPRGHYSLQAATKASYRFFLESLRQEIVDQTRVMMIHPSSVQTNIFKKAGDKRTLLKYPTPEVIAKMMSFMLAQPKIVEIPEIIVRNRA